MFYLIIIVLATVFIAFFNILFQMPLDYSEALRIVANSAIGTVSVIAVDGLFAFLIRRCLPQKWFNADSKRFIVSENERKFYRRLKINKWKDKVPELGGFTGFHKNKMSNPGDIEFLGRYLMESNFGVVIHIVNVFDGIFIMLIPPCSAPSVAVPIILVNAVLSFLPVMILRFNTFSLKVLYDKRRNRQKEN